MTPLLTKKSLELKKVVDKAYLSSQITVNAGNANMIADAVYSNTLNSDLIPYLPLNWLFYYQAYLIWQKGKRCRGKNACFIAYEFDTTEVMLDAYFDGFIHLNEKLNGKNIAEICQQLRQRRCAVSIYLR